MANIHQNKGNILVAGGAGYVGSHTCLALAEAGYTPVVFDNLSNGHKEFVQWGPCIVGDIRDELAVKQVFQDWKPVGVVHFAALIEVGISVKDPVSFYETNVKGAINLISEAYRSGVKGFVFSSTCATYGAPEYVPMDEKHPQFPLSPYGNTKLCVEKYLTDMRECCEFPSIALRYFNAAGADPEGRIGERHDPETHAIPIAIEAAMGLRPGFSLFGTDYDTRDGTCVRDYIHVLDLADAHVCALGRLLGGELGGAYNLGTGTGTTVKELVEMIRKISGEAFPVAESERRDGDSSVLVADRSKAKKELGWVPKRGLEQIVQDAWNWHNK
ncbi:MAG: UDP-glucose 4-epimerase GalE [Robiginitomaculum sp.]|nr:MAG: UDP-glucose 4-epimerase GalE [Robiginitomaculum sp.]